MNLSIDRFTQHGHHYFPTKGDLGATLASQYTDAGCEALERIFTETSNVTERLNRYTTIFRQALANDNRMCLVGILAAEHHDLPAEVRAEVARFTEANIAWLRRVLGAARPRRAAAEIDGWALAIFAAVEGAQLIARGCGDLKAYDRAIGAYRTAGLLP